MTPYMSYILGASRSAAIADAIRTARATMVHVQTDEMWMLDLEGQIVLALLDNHPQGWGYKLRSEATVPFYWSCPEWLLNLADQPATEGAKRWRVLYHMPEDKRLLEVEEGQEGYEDNASYDDEDDEDESAWTALEEYQLADALTKKQIRRALQLYEHKTSEWAAFEYLREAAPKQTHRYAAELLFIFKRATKKKTYGKAENYVRERVRPRRLQEVLLERLRFACR